MFRPDKITDFSKLQVQLVPGTKNGRQLWKLVEPLEFSLTLNDAGGLAVTVPRGYVTDFASVPRLFWFIVPPTGAWCPAAVVHDYLYQVPTCSRFLADAVFREAMHQLGVPFWRRVMMYYAVRLFGASHKITTPVRKK